MISNVNLYGFSSVKRCSQGMSSINTENWSSCVVSYLNTVAGFYSDQMLRPGYVQTVFTHCKTTAVFHIMDSQEKGTGVFKQKLHTLRC